MKGGKNRQPLVVRQPRAGQRPVSGYTIVEVMIVLAVSGVMFLIAASFINGKQARTAFTAGVNQMASNLQDIIEQVTDGKYSDIPLSCLFDGTRTPALTFPAGNNQQGTNASCVFLGKILHFQESGLPGTTYTQQYEIFSLAGGRANGSTALATPTAADATVISSPTADLTDQQTTPQSLDVSKVTFNVGGLGPTKISYGLGFLQGQGSLDATNNLISGPQNVSMYYVSSLVGVSGTDKPTAIGIINGGSNLKQAQNVDICLTDGTRYADITVGNNGSNASQLVVNVKMDGTTRPATC
jgi:prepilin-type N-terminal cleavage/methylation domain-containing protein